MKALEKDKLFGNLKKCTFFSNEVTFLGYVMTSNGILWIRAKWRPFSLGLLPKAFTM